MLDGELSTKGLGETTRSEKVANVRTAEILRERGVKPTHISGSHELLEVIATFRIAYASLDEMLERVLGHKS